MYKSLLSKSKVIKQEKASWIVTDTAQIKEYSSARNDFIELINEILLINLTYVTVTDETLL
jgi:hypothetical protein